MVFPLVMYGCESWTVKKAECWRISAFELWCWKRLLRVPWTARRSNQYILKEISPEYSLEGLMLKLQTMRQGEEQVHKQNWTQVWHFVETEKSERHLYNKRCDVDGARQISCSDLMKVSYQCRVEEILIGRLYILFLHKIWNIPWKYEMII